MQDHTHEMDLTTRNATDLSGAGMLALTRDLCAFRTAVVADDNEALFARIGRELPLEFFRFASGDTFNGWQVPQNWRVRRAKLFRDGTRAVRWSGPGPGRRATIRVRFRASWTGRSSRRASSAIPICPTR